MFLISNTFLFFGIIFGLLMALSYAGTISIDITRLLHGHVFMVLGGYISITIMGLSIVLVPMFTLSHGFSMKPLKISITLMSIGVLLVTIGALFGLTYLEYIGYFSSIVSLGFYFYIIYIIYKTRPRKENDVYAISAMFSYISMLVSVIIGVAYYITGKEELLLASVWLFFYGFFCFFNHWSYL